MGKKKNVTAQFWLFLELWETILIILTFPPELEWIKSSHYSFIVFSAVLETGFHTSYIA